MAMNLTASCLLPNPNPNCPIFLSPKHSHLPKLFSLSPSFRSAAQADATEGGLTDENPPPVFSRSLPSARTQLDLLEQLTSTSPSLGGYGSESESESSKLTIREQLAQLVGDRDDDFSIPLGKNLKKVSAKFLTTSQKRNIRRQAYLNEVSQRNDSVFFATIGVFIILPPLVILGIAIITGYVQLFP